MCLLDVLAVAAIYEQESAADARIEGDLHFAAGGRGEKPPPRALRIKPRIENPFGTNLKVSCDSNVAEVAFGLALMLLGIIKP